MITVDKTFQGKLIVKGMVEEDLQKFVSNLIINGWTDRKIPSGMKFVNSGEKLTVEMMPKNFNIEETASKAVKKGIMMLEKIGVVDFGLSLRITRTNQGANPTIRVELDKYEFEKDGNPLDGVVNKSIKNL